MTHLEKPVYLIACGDKWLLDKSREAALAFGTRDEANDYAAKLADEQGILPSLYRVVGYEFGNKVYEVRETVKA